MYIVCFFLSFVEVRALFLGRTLFCLGGRYPVV